jgi:glucose-6-phosphate isomerase, archaeal
MIAAEFINFFRDNGELEGKNVIHSIKKIDQLKNIFRDEAARAAMPPSTIVYEVTAHLPVAAGTEGGLFFGTTTIKPGMVGNEYFMTQGHFHQKSDRAEYYWCLQGEGMLLLMERDRTCRVEPMSPRTLHYIPGHTGHRVVNTGNEDLIFSACWPSDAGYDYDEIIRNGFSKRIICENKKPSIITI